MKDPAKLQQKLIAALRQHSELKLNLHLPCSDTEFSEIAWVVQDYVNQNGDVTNDDPLHAWLEEYQFYLTQVR